MQKLEEVLKFHGFTKLESKVYLKLLEMNQSKVSELGKITEITRTQLYPLLDNMLEKGYIKQIGTKPVTYEVIDPQELVKILREQYKKQNESLADLESKLDEVKPIQKIQGMMHKTYLIKGRNNIIRKLIELWEGVEKEVIMTSVFERELLEGSKRLAEIFKEKAKKGVKNIVYLSIKPENLYKIKEMEKILKHATFGSLIKEQPYVTIVFDKKYVMIAFYDPRKEQYDSALYIENTNLAESFASKNIAPIESYPLNGEVRLSVIGGERALIIPPVLETISKIDQYKLGYGVGWYGIKPLKNLNHSNNSLIMMLMMQIMTNGWGKARINNSKNNEIILSIENSVVTPEFMKGDIEGFLSIMGNYIVKENLIDQKERHYEFIISLKSRKTS